jgi:glycosyltransferase involved in cell wall biosynthesis
VDEVLVMDNRSTDETAKVARVLGARVIREDRADRLGIGYGYAHQKGLQKATGDIIVTMDGDGTYPLNQIKEVGNYLLRNELDFVACSRFPLTDNQVISRFRQFGVWALNMAVKMLYWYPMQDILSGMWVMRRGIVRQLKLTEGGWDLSPEIKLNALTDRNIKFGQYHIRHFRRENGASKQQLWITGSNHLWYILKRWIIRDNLVVQAGQVWTQRIIEPIKLKVAYLFN